MSEDWIFDGTSVQSFCWRIESRDGWDDLPGIRGSNTVLSGKHGSSWRPKKYDEGKKTLVLGVHGVSDEYFTTPWDPQDEHTLYEEHLDDLLRLVSVRHRLISVERVHSSGSRRQAQCEVFPSAPVPAGNGYAQVSLSISVPEAFWEDVDETAYSLPFDYVAGGTQTLEAYNLVGQDGYCADAVLTISGVCTSVTVRDTETQSGFTYAGGLTAGQGLVVDAGEFTALKGTLVGGVLTGSPVDVSTDLTLYDGQILEIAPAPQSYRGPTLDVTAPGANDDFLVTLVTRRKWVR